MNEIRVEVGNKKFALRESSDGDFVVWRAFDLATNTFVDGAEFVISEDVLSDIKNTDQFHDPSEVAINELKKRLKEQFGKDI